MAFTEVAKNIIKETIGNAVFIDDKARENFKQKNYKHKDDQNRTVELYKDFKTNNCLLHSFRYTKRGWKEFKRFHLKNKDLLILDWQLVGESHHDAFKVLDEAVVKKSLHFVCIYTGESKDSVLNELHRYYRGHVSDDLKQNIREKISSTELDLFWKTDDLDRDKLDLDEEINSIINAKEEDRDNEINTLTEKYDINEEIKEYIINIVPGDIPQSFLKLRSALLKEEVPFSNNDFGPYFKISANNPETIYINHTIVKIFGKKEVKGDKLYDSFVDSLMKERNIFLSIMGLEMRNRFRENSAFIGKDFDDLSEDAFFHHRNKNKENPFIFYNYLREILKDQVASFMYESNLEIFDVLDEYYKEINGSARLAKFTAPENVKNSTKELYKLNYFYNRINIYHRKVNDFLRFGDVFHTEIIAKNEKNGKDEVEAKYFLCITPHCDCLRPTDNIKNQFWFVEGKLLTNKKNVLKSTDAQFISFVKDNNEEIVAIGWRKNDKFCKPFTMNVPNHRFTDELVVDYYGQSLSITLITSIKENYAQRIANEASGYNLRVGIDFVKK